MEIAVLPKDELARLLEQAARRGAEAALRAIAPPAENEPDKPLTAREVAEMVGVSYDTFMSKTRHLPGFPRPAVGAGKGQKKLWRKSQIEKWLAAQVVSK